MEVVQILVGICVNQYLADFEQFRDREPLALSAGRGGRNLSASNGGVAQGTPSHVRT